MKSIQSRLLFWLAGMMICLSLFSAAALTAILRRALIREFDQSLITRAHALQSDVTQKPDGRLDIDLSLSILTEYRGFNATDYFCVVDAAGHRLAGSSSYQLPGRPTGFFGIWETQLANSAPARAMTISFSPQPEPDEDDDSGRTHRAAPVTLTLTVARNRRSLDALLLRVTAITALMGLLLSISAVVASVVIVRGGLKALRGLGREAELIEFTRPDARFASAGLPAELAPIVDRLNGMLQRVAQAFARERQFSAAVSHELRTPIAELRIIADIAGREPDNLALAQRCVVQSKEIALHMQTLISTLISIASPDRSAESIRTEPLLLRSLVDLAAARHASELHRQQVRLLNSVDDHLRIQGNQTLINAVLDNLLANAARYTPAGSTLLVRSENGQSPPTLILQNPQQGLTFSDIERVFDPFWRKDSARTSSEQVGLGLTLVRAYCNAMNATVSARLSERGDFELSIQFDQASAPGGAA